MGTGELNAGGNPATDKHPIQGGVKILLVTSCYRNLKKRWPDCPASWIIYADITLVVLRMQFWRAYFQGRESSPIRKNYCTPGVLIITLKNDNNLRIINIFQKQSSKSTIYCIENNTSVGAHRYGIISPWVFTSITHEWCIFHYKNTCVDKKIWI